MSHECPECGALCFCNGDIDDCMLNVPKYQDRCRHYLEPECCGYEGDDDEEGFYYDPAEGDAPLGAEEKSQANAQQANGAGASPHC